MKCLPVLYFLLLPYCSKAQYIPDSVTYSPEKFAGYLQNKFADPSTQLRLLYNWITSNIKYSKDSSLYFNWNAGHESKINATLRRRKGVCENFATLFVDIAGRLSISAFVVHGYPASMDKNKDNSHSWVAVKEKEEWYLCDPTWDAQSMSEQYFMIQPSTFIETHIPFDPLWQLLEKPLNYSSATTKFNYKDSVKYFLQLDSLQQFLEAEKRINKSGYKNRMTNNWQRYNQMNVAIIAGEEDSKLYNAAVEELNNANNFFNSFLRYRNQQFTPLKTDQEIKAMLLPVGPLLIKAENNLKLMGRLKDNFQYDPETIRQRITSLDKKMQEQQRFLDNYFPKNAQERIKLFYH